MKIVELQKDVIIEKNNVVQFVIFCNCKMKLLDHSKWRDLYKSQRNVAFNRCMVCG